MNLWAPLEFWQRLVVGATMPKVEPATECQGETLWVTPIVTPTFQSEALFWQDAYLKKCAVLKYFLHIHSLPLVTQWRSLCCGGSWFKSNVFKDLPNQSDLQWAVRSPAGQKPLWAQPLSKNTWWDSGKVSVGTMPPCSRSNWTHYLEYVLWIIQEHLWKGGTGSTSKIIIRYNSYTSSVFFICH